MNEIVRQITGMHATVQHESDNSSQESSGHSRSIIDGENTDLAVSDSDGDGVEPRTDLEESVTSIDLPMVSNPEVGNVHGNAGAEAVEAATYPSTYRSHPISSAAHKRARIEGLFGLSTKDVDEVRATGSPISGFATTAYLSCVTREYGRYCVRCTGELFWPRLKRHAEEHGRNGAWNHILKDTHTQVLGSQQIYWEHCPLLLLQIFSGPTRLGSFSLLVVDRTIHKPGLLVFISSKPKCNSLFADLQDLLRETPLVKVDSKWIHASMFEEAEGSYDCGVFMATVAAAYVKKLHENCILARTDSSDKDSVNDDSSNEVVNKVEVATGLGVSPRQLGRYARNHMVKTLESNSFDAAHTVFTKFTVRIG